MPIQSITTDTNNGSWLGDSEEGWEIYQMSKKLALNEKNLPKIKYKVDG